MPQSKKTADQVRVAELEALVAQLREDKEALEQSQALFESIADSGSDIQVKHDLDGRVVWANKAVEEILGYTVDECRAMTGFPVPLVHEADRDRVRSTIWQQLRAPSPGRGLRHRIRCKSGQEKWMEVNWKPVFGEEGQHRGWLTVVRDASQNVALEEDLRRQRDFAASILDTARAIIVVLDNNGCIVSINKYLESLSGHLLADVKGQDWFDTFLPRRDHQRIRDVFQDAVSDVQTLGNLNPIVTRDGREIDIEWYDKTLKDGAGITIGLLAIGLDITQRRQAEEERQQLEAQVRHVQKLESLGVLAGGIAHDFNNILVGILGAASLASIQVSGDPVLEDLIRTIDKSARRAADLTHQMLAYAGKGKFVAKESDVHHMIDNVLGLLRSSVPKANELNIDLQQGLPRVWVDATQIQQVIMNLVTNAAEAIGAGPGQISLITRLRVCDGPFLTALRPDEELEAGDYVTLAVSDTGCGMDDKTRAKIFDPFFTTKLTGRGLGLAAVHGIMRGHRGAIEVESQLGKGTTCTIFLPVFKADLTHQSQELPVGGDLDWCGSGTVLLVDDEHVVRNVARRILEKIGFEVVVASDGLEALQVFDKHRGDIDLVILDLDMPRLDGRQTFDRLRQVDDEVPILLCSGYGREFAAARFESNCVSAFLEKPYTVGALRRKLREVLGA